MAQAAKAIDSESEFVFSEMTMEWQRNKAYNSKPYLAAVCKMEDATLNKVLRKTELKDRGSNPRTRNRVVTCWLCDGITTQTCQCHNGPLGSKPKPCNMVCNLRS